MSKLLNLTIAGMVVLTGWLMVDFLTHPPAERAPTPPTSTPQQAGEPLNWYWYDTHCVGSEVRQRYGSAAACQYFFETPGRFGTLDPKNPPAFHS